MRNQTRSYICYLAIASLVESQFLMAAGPRQELASNQKPAVAWSSGVIRINGTDFSGSGNVKPGANLETLRASSQLYLADGTRVRLAAATRMDVQSDQVRLEAGTARVEPIPENGRLLQVNAGILDVKTAGGTIQRPAANQLIVTAVGKPTEIRKVDGLLIAMVRPGETMAFSMPPKDDASSPTKIAGQVERAEKQFYLTDSVSKVRTELRGGQAERFEGKLVCATGELVKSKQEGQRTLVVRSLEVIESQDQAKSCSEAGVAAAAAAGAGAGAGVAASGAGAGTAAGAGAATGAGAAAAGTAAAAGAGTIAGISTGVFTTVAVVGGVAVAAGVAAVVVAGGDEPQTISQ